MTDTIQMITETYTQVVDGKKKVVIEEGDVKVTTYRVGNIIRIDIKGEELNGT